MEKADNVHKKREHYFIALNATSNVSNGSFWFSGITFRKSLTIEIFSFFFDMLVNLSKSLVVL